MTKNADVDLLMARFEKEPRHPLHVARLAMQLFSGLNFWHKAPALDRQLLETAAWLHDIGWSQAKDGSKHHKWSARLIRRHHWKTLKEEEVDIVALIARYHRKSLPHMKHEPYSKMSPGVRARISNMAAVLRVADALDRRHLQSVTNVKVHLSVDSLVISVKSLIDPAPECDMALKKGDLLRLLTGKNLEIVRHA